MRQNRIRKVIREERMAILSHVGFADPALVEIIALAGFDGVFIDMEHTSFNLSLIGEMVRVAELAGISPVIRVPENNPTLIGRILDMGAHGVSVPHTASAEDAERAVAAVRYPPLGQRGAAPASRAIGYGTIPRSEHERQSNEEILLIVMVEDLKGINDIDAIAAVDGVDMISLGPSDLSAALGVTGSNDNKLRDTVLDLAARVNRIGKAKLYIPMYHPVLSFTPKELLQIGVNIALVAPTPQIILMNALRDSVQHIREEAGQAVGA